MAAAQRLLVVLSALTFFFVQGITAQPAEAAAPTLKTPANARTIGSCTTKAPGTSVKGTALVDTFAKWRGIRIGAFATGSKTTTTRTTFAGATLVHMDRTGRYIRSSHSPAGYWLIPGRDPKPGDRVKVTIHWRTTRLGLPAERRSCAIYLTPPRSFAISV